MTKTRWTASVLMASIWARAIALAGPTVTVLPENSVIVHPPKASKTQENAVLELQKHLQLVTGLDISTRTEDRPGDDRYPFYVGIPLPGDDKTLAAEEARWAVSPDATYLYGHTLFAVYGFLEEELGVRWLEPGDRGIAFRKQSPLSLRSGVFNWVPGLGFRSIRVGLQRRKEAQTAREESQPSPYQRIRRDFTLPVEAHNRYFEDVVTWRARMRMGGHLGRSYGHAFTDWWQRYGETHPEYFAIAASGKRGPQSDHPKALRCVKLCPSNPNVADRIVENWLAHPRRGSAVNVCENDSAGGVPRGFCACADCKALDVVIEGEEGAFGQHLTDRYVYLANAVARKAREHDPDVTVWMYAYNEYEQPPRREKLEPNIVVGFVPYTLDIDRMEEHLGGWTRMGMKKMFVRPNWPWYFDKTTIPLGYDKHFYDLFQAARKYGLVGTDYDCLRHYWPVTAMTVYVQARAFSDPDKPFEYWEEHFCSAYGPAAADVKRYHRYWREEVWEKRLREFFMPERNLGGRIDRLMESLDKYYRPEDFDRTDAILRDAAGRNLSDPERNHLEQLVLAKRHARLVFDAAVAQDAEKRPKALALLEFRRAHRDNLSFRWEKVFQYHGDLLGLTALAAEE